MEFFTPPGCDCKADYAGAYKAQQEAARRDHYRAEAEDCGRDEIVLNVYLNGEGAGYPPSMCAFAAGPMSEFALDALLGPNPEEWPHQARELVNRVHRYRELLRQAGCEI